MFGVVRRLSVRKESIAPGHPSSPGLPVHQIRERGGDPLAKGFLRVTFGRVIDTIGYLSPLVVKGLGGILNG